MKRIPESSAPDTKNTSWTVAAEITVPEKGADGMLATMGGRFAGWGLWLADSKPQFAYALSNQPAHKFRIASDSGYRPGIIWCALNFIMTAAA